MFRLASFLSRFLQSRNVYVSRHPEIKYFTLITDQIVKNFLSKSQGVLHIGAYEGEERFLYESLGLEVLWVEALPDTFKVLEINISGFDRQKALNVILGDQDIDLIDFHVSSNGQSSSILEFSNVNSFEGVHTSQVIQAPMKTLDNVALEHVISKLNFWVIDVQGAELLVLNGSKQSLNYCDYLLVEASTIEFYRGGVLWEELTNFLESRGFTSIWQPNGVSHLNVLFIRTLPSRKIRI